MRAGCNPSSGMDVAKAKKWEKDEGIGADEGVRVKGWGTQEPTHQNSDHSPAIASVHDLA